MERFGGDYLQMVSAFVIDNSDLFVSFRNGETVTIPTTAVLFSQAEDVNWNQMKLGSFGTKIIVPYVSNENRLNVLEIPSDKIRLLTDPQFAQHIHRLALEQYKHIGSRIRQLREERRFNHKEVSRKTALCKAVLAGVEAGNPNVFAWSLVSEILSAIGCSVKDLSVMRTQQF